MKPLYLIAEIYPHPDKLEAAHNLFSTLVENTLEEPGCLLYDLVIEEDADHWLMLEKWESRTAWEHHMTTAHVVEANKLAASLVRNQTKLRFLSEL
ncbi:MAG: putative quinol monooxygenase [Vulcanococcus sp.]